MHFSQEFNDERIGNSPSSRRNRGMYESSAEGKDIKFVDFCDLIVFHWSHVEESSKNLSSNNIRRHTCFAYCMDGVNFIEIPPTSMATFYFFGTTSFGRRHACFAYCMEEVTLIEITPTSMTSFNFLETTVLGLSPSRSSTVVEYSGNLRLRKLIETSRGKNVPFWFTIMNFLVLSRASYGDVDSVPLIHGRLHKQP